MFNEYNIDISLNEVISKKCLCINLNYVLVKGLILQLVSEINIVI